MSSGDHDPIVAIGTAGHISVADAVISLLGPKGDQYQDMCAMAFRIHLAIPGRAGSRIFP